MEKISSLDLSGLVDLTTIDGEYFDKLLIKVGHRPQNKFTDFTYCKYVAMHVTNRPAEFFNMLGIRDMMIVIALINHFFMYGQGLVMTGQ